MRVAILSDIHGNILALEAVLADLEARGGADVVAIAGDLCLDGPRPREVLERVRALGSPVVQGNTDYSLALPPEELEDRETADLHAWAREQIGDEGIEYLRNLPFAHRIREPEGEGVVLIVHANPQDRDQHLRPLAPESEVAPLLEGVAPEITTIAFGHLHIPYVRQVGRLRLVNISSVGQPKDGDRRAGYGLLTWHDGGWQIEQRRVEYPVEEVVRQLREADPPGVDDLVKTLLRARYPNMAVARGGSAATRRASATRRTRSGAPAEEGPDMTANAGDEAANRAEYNAAAVLVPAAGDQSPEASASSETSQVDELTGEEVEPISADVRAAQPAAGPAPAAPATAEVLAAEVEGLLADLDHAVLTAAEEASPEEREQLADVMGEIDSRLAEMDMAVAEDAGDVARASKKARKAARRAARAGQAVDMVADEPFAVTLPAILSARLDTVLSFIEGVRADEDPEAVHDMRVASRRLRAALDAAKPCYNKKDFRRALRRVRELAGALGEVRDADVLLEFLHVRRAAAPRKERAGLDGLIDAINAHRAAARDDLDPVLELWEDEDDGHVADFRRFAGKVLVRKKPRTRDLVGGVAARAIAERLDAFEESAVIFNESEGGTPEAFHDLRIAAKQLRYMIELFAPALGDEAKELLDELKTLQDTLGTLHDRDVLIDLLARERAEALERQLHILEYATFNPGTREERLAAVRDYLDAPDSFARTALGIYGLLIDAGDERNALEDELRARWATLDADGFCDRVRALAAGSLERAAGSADDEGEAPDAELADEEEDGTQG